ncbi:ABC transporter substrate-binding protein [Haloplanus sp. GCM10025708]|uniref:ABC transporter substrate-binding protein n=1 Tax=Haloferacaceae TaxID=1644056 RepID=UPI0036199B68
MADRADTRRRTFLKGASTVALAGLAGCSGGGSGGGGSGGTESSGGSGGSTTGTPGSSAIDSLTVGVATSLSGPFAVFGQAELDGARLAKQDLEEEFGISIEIATGDTEVTPSTGLQRMKRLVTKDGIDFAMGGVSSSVALKMGSWASDNGVSYFATGAHSDQITGDGCTKYMYRPTCSNSMLANTIGAEMAESADDWYLLYSDYTWGQTAQKAVTNVLESQGKNVVGKSATPFPNDDYTSYVNEAKASDADGIGLLVAGLEMRKALSTVIDKGLDERTLAMHQSEDIVYWGLDREMAGALDIAGQVWGTAVDAGQEFKQRVADNAESDPYVRHFLGYASMDQAVRAAMRAESTAADAMRDAIEGHEVTSPVKDIKGSGKMYWRECDHQLVQDTYSVKARSTDEMVDDPYKTWFETVNTFSGDDVARSCDQTGCSL